LRFYLGGQLNTFATDTGGLTGVSTDTSRRMAVRWLLPVAPSSVAPPHCWPVHARPGALVVAPQRPIRAFGGFVQLGLPLSRWFNADPKGHNAGWQLHFTVGKDQVNGSGPEIILASPAMPTFCGTIAPSDGQECHSNPVLQTQHLGHVRLRAVDLCYPFEDHLTLYTIAGSPSNEWQDHRTEFGPIFTF
jgi:hypothetical protein